MSEPEDVEIEAVSIGPIFRHGQLSIENHEVVQRLNLADCTFGVQVGEDGRVWVCVNGMAYLRFKPTPTTTAHQHLHAVALPPERDPVSNMYRARCNCGWTSEAVYDEGRARAFGAGHIDYFRSTPWDCETDHGASP